MKRERFTTGRLITRSCLDTKTRSRSVKSTATSRRVSARVFASLSRKTRNSANSGCDFDLEIFATREWHARRSASRTSARKIRLDSSLGRGQGSRSDTVNRALYAARRTHICARVYVRSISFRRHYKILLRRYASKTESAFVSRAKRALRW